MTYGEPSLRLSFLNDCVNINNQENVKINVEKIELSMLSNLINSLRNRSKDGAIQSALKDSTILLNSLVDVYDCKISDKELDQETRKKYLCMKVVALAKLKKIEKQKKLEQLAIDMKTEKKEQTHDSDNISQKIATENQIEPNKISDNLRNEDNKLETLLEKLDIGQKNEKGNQHNPQEEKLGKRRTHCYAYTFTKLQ